MSRKEPCKCARTRAAAATRRLNSRTPEALWARRKGPWSTEPRSATQVRLKAAIFLSFSFFFSPPLFPFITKILRLAVDRNEETLKRSSVEKSLSIMDYYQHDVFTHLEKDSRRISQYNLLHKESSLDSTAGERLSVSIKTAVTAVKTLYRHAGDSYEAFYCSSHPRMTSRNLRRQWYLLTYSDDGCSQWLISLTLKEKSKIRTAN